MAGPTNPESRPPISADRIDALIWQIKKEAAKGERAIAEIERIIPLIEVKPVAQPVPDPTLPSGLIIEVLQLPARKGRARDVLDAAAVTLVAELPAGPLIREGSVGLDEDPLLNQPDGRKLLLVVAVVTFGQAIARLELGSAHVLQIPADARLGGVIALVAK